MRIVEFFEGAGNRLSMTRLTVFLSFWPASWVVVNESSSETLGWYLGAYVLGYVGGKGADAFISNKELETTSDSDTASASSVTSSVMEKRRAPVARSKKRAF